MGACMKVNCLEYGPEPYARGMWYWKDLLNKPGIVSLILWKTWDGYITSARKINSVLGPMGISGVVLVGLNYSPDIWYPYLWMLLGHIVMKKMDTREKGGYWFPAYNSTAGVKVLEFIKEQIDAGIKPIKVIHTNCLLIGSLLCGSGPGYQVLFHANNGQLLGRVLALYLCFLYLIGLIRHLQDGWVGTGYSSNFKK